MANQREDFSIEHKQQIGNSAVQNMQDEVNRERFRNMPAAESSNQGNFGRDGRADSFPNNRIDVPQGAILDGSITNGRKAQGESDTPAHNKGRSKAGARDSEGLGQKILQGAQGAYDSSERKMSQGAQGAYASSEGRLAQSARAGRESKMAQGFKGNAGANMRDNRVMPEFGGQDNMQENRLAPGFSGDEGIYANKSFPGFQGDEGIYANKSFPGFQGDEGIYANKAPRGFSGDESIHTDRAFEGFNGDRNGRENRAMPEFNRGPEMGEIDEGRGIGDGWPSDVPGQPIPGGGPTNPGALRPFLPNEQGGQNYGRNEMMRPQDSRRNNPYRTQPNTFEHERGLQGDGQIVIPPLQW